MSFSLGYVVLSTVTKILATGMDRKLPNLSEPALTFQLDTSRYFLGAETVEFRPKPCTSRLYQRLGSCLRRH